MDETEPGPSPASSGEDEMKGVLDRLSMSLIEGDCGEMVRLMNFIEQKRGMERLKSYKTSEGENIFQLSASSPSGKTARTFQKRYRQMTRLSKSESESHNRGQGTTHMRRNKTASERSKEDEDNQKELNDLAKNILLGETTKALGQLKTIFKEEFRNQVENYTDEHNGDSLLHLAALSYSYKKPAVMKMLLKMFPKLLKKGREGRLEGETALHIVITNVNKDLTTGRGLQNHGDPSTQKKAAIEAAKILLKSADVDGSGKPLLQLEATGSDFENTVLMGKLPLHTAALCMHHEMVELLIQNGASLHAQNSDLGDTVLHTLVRYAECHPDKMTEVIDMLQYLHRIMTPRPHQKVIKIDQYQPTKRDSLGFWLMENNDGFSPLRLAASLGVPEIFKEILKLEGVYCHLDSIDGVSAKHIYDITEIDTLAMRKWVRPDQNHNKVSPFDGLQDQSESSQPSDGNQSKRGKDVKSVLEIIHGFKESEAFPFMQSQLIEEILTKKWEYYKWVYLVLSLLHIAFMILLTVYTVSTAKLSFEDLYLKGNSTDSVSMMTYQKPTDSDRSFADAMKYIGFSVSITIFILEFIKWFRSDSKLKNVRRQTGLYRWVPLIMALSLFADFIASFVYPNFHAFLMFTVILGWWHCTFFLKAFKKFSFFSYMFERVFFGDLMRFGMYILVQLISFTVVMHAVFLSTNPVPESFRHFGIAFMTMFQLMMGLTEFESLFDAREEWLAEIIYAIFILMTYVLLFNALIAMMSQTCVLASENRKLLWQSQRLQLIILAESILFQKCWKEHESKNINVYDIHTDRPKRIERSFIKIKSRSERRVGNEHKKVSNNWDLAFSGLKTIDRSDEPMSKPVSAGSDKPKKHEPSSAGDSTKKCDKESSQRKQQPPLASQLDCEDPDV